MNVTTDISIGQIITILLTVIGFGATIIAGWYAIKYQAQSTAKDLALLTGSTSKDLADLKSVMKDAVDRLGDRVGSVEKDLQALRLEIAKEYVSVGKLKDLKDELTNAIGDLKQTVMKAVTDSAKAVEAAREAQAAQALKSARRRTSVD